VTEFNNSRLVSEFRLAYETEDDVTAFIRERTLIPHDTVLVVACSALVVFAIFVILDQSTTKELLPWRTTEEKSGVSSEEKSVRQSRSSEHPTVVIEEDENGEETASEVQSEHSEEEEVVLQTEMAVSAAKSELPECLKPIPLKSPPPILDAPSIRRNRRGPVPAWMKTPNAMSVSETESSSYFSSDSL
jgi:hypothetical protein